MKRVNVSVKLKKNKTNFIADLKRRNIKSRMTALLSVMTKANLSELNLVNKNFFKEVQCLSLKKGNVDKAVAHYKKQKA